MSHPIRFGYKASAEQFTPGEKCHSCNAQEQTRNPVLRTAPGWHSAGEADTFNI